jgi:hypothetical protein
MPDSPYGAWGKHIELFEAWREWSDELSLQEADSKADFPTWLYGPVRTAVWGGYTRIQPQYRRYARVENMPDFRPRLLKGINALRGYGHVGDHGEYAGMRRTERPGASLVIDTYGAIYGITRQAIINDDTGELLNRIPADMGYQAARFVAETLVALVLSNPTAPDGNPMFSAGRGNQVTSALSEDSIADAITFMEQQLDDDGFQIIVEAASLIVQNARQQLIANRILNSQFTGTNVTYTGGTAGVGTAQMDKGTINPLNGILPADAVVREAFFSDNNDWYMFARPDDVPAFAVGFLNGKETPDVLLKDPGVRNALGAGTDPYSWEIDSIDFKVRHDFGVAAVDPRGAYRAIVP